MAWVSGGPPAGVGLALSERGALATAGREQDDTRKARATRLAPGRNPLAPAGEKTAIPTTLLLGWLRDTRDNPHSFTPQNQTQ